MAHSTVPSLAHRRGPTASCCLSCHWRQGWRICGLSFGTQRDHARSAGRGLANQGAAAVVTPDLRIGDRRGLVRFAVVGVKSASLLSSQMMRVLDVGANGALVESALPLPVNAEYRMQLVLEGHVSEATVKIRRVAEAWDSSALRYHIGLEFLTISEEATEVITQLLSAGEARI
jgi:hypothetical protein